MASGDDGTDTEATPPKADTEAFLAWLEKVPDPVRRYSLATSELQKYQQTVQRLSSLRSDALADAAADDSISALARRLGVSRQRAHQLVAESKGGKGKAGQPRIARTSSGRQKKDKSEETKDAMKERKEKKH